MVSRVSPVRIICLSVRRNYEQKWAYLFPEFIEMLATEQWIYAEENIKTVWKKYASYRTYKYQIGLANILS